jgi:hypothetical protein
MERDLWAQLPNPRLTKTRKHSIFVPTQRPTIVAKPPEMEHEQNHQPQVQTLWRDRNHPSYFRVPL